MRAMPPTDWTLRRRALLRGGAALAAAAGLPLVFSYRRTARADYGALIPDPDGLFDLPAGFRYTIVDRAGDLMTDGYRVPGAPDAMGAFPGPGGTVILMRNHELTAGGGPYGPNQGPPPEAYDPAATGGVTRVVFDGSTLEVLSRNLVLVGTRRNCAGGLSPWGWLSCEEDVADGHGYTFLCPIDAEAVAPPRKLAGYGRCNHEAACVDPDTHCAYLTEDRGDGCLYRFVPADRADPFTGKLQALRVKRQDMFATTAMDVQETVEVEWVDLAEPDPAGDTLRHEAQAKGAAIFVRGEGLWFSGGAVYICSTTGGPAEGGQIFKLVDGPEGGVLELLARSDDRDRLDMPDNICVAPWGELFMAEDGDGDNYVRVLRPTGEVVDFGRTRLSQLAGVCFAPDGQTMFLNLQDIDTTIAVRGPFPRLDEPDPTTGDPTTGGPVEPDPTTAASTGAAPPSDSTDSDTAADDRVTDLAGCDCDSSDGDDARDLALAAAGLAALRGLTRPAGGG